MMTQKSFRISKVLLSLLLFISFILPTELSANKVQAATKPSIDSEVYIGIGSIGWDEYSNSYSKSGLHTLTVYAPVKKATYSFTSSNKNVVTVKASGTKAYLTGVKAGTATITCQQKLNGKTTKVGTCNVTVAAAKVYGEFYVLPLGTGEHSLFYYSFRNCSATYSLTSNSKDFIIKENIKKETGSKDYYNITQTYTAKKPGTYTVTVKETYNKKVRTVGKVEFNVLKATVADDNALYIGETRWAFMMINNYRTDVDYLFDGGEDGILDFYLEEGTVYLKALKVGTATLKIYEDATEPDESKLVGTCNITVKDLIVESIESYYYDTEAYVGGYAIGLDVYKTPWNATDAIKVSSSDPSIATVSDPNENNYFEITPISEGTVTITITCGEFTETKTITIYADEDAMYENY